MATKKISHPSLLSVIRAHNLSVFPMYGVAAAETKDLFGIDLNKAAPVIVNRETVRGTQAAAATVEAKRGVPNVQAVDFASLPSGTDTLLISGTVLVTGKGVLLENNNSAEFAQAHAEFMTQFAAAGGMRQLAERFVMNLLNGAILFRNRIGSNITCALRAGDIAIQVREDQIAKLGSLSIADITDAELAKSAAALADLWEQALLGKRHALTVSVRTSVEMGAGQEVYPSQEFVQDQDKGQGRVLALAPRNDAIKQAAMHGRKVGNALRTIDTWYPDAIRALPVEPFGVDQSAQDALRKSGATGTDFYSLMLRMPELAEELKKGEVTGESLFVAAVFLRGGVFSKKADTTKDKKGEE